MKECATERGLMKKVQQDTERVSSLSASADSTAPLSLRMRG
jgi:hypothetical protein